MGLQARRRRLRGARPTTRRPSVRMSTLRPAHGPLGLLPAVPAGGDLVQAGVIRRQRCRACRRSHVVLPQFVTNGRLDEVGVIGEGTEAMVAGRGARKVAADLGLPHTTVRDWRRRFRSRAVLLAMGVAAAVVALAGTLPRLSADPEQAALQAMAAAWAVVAARRPIIGSAFSLANAICGSHLLSTNMQPPWAVL